MVDEAAMEAMYDETLKNLNEGTIVSGKILSVIDGDVLIDIGYKSEGIVSVQEFTDLEEEPIGQEVEVFLEQLEDNDGMIVLSKRRAVQQRAWDYVVNECEEGSLVEGTIKNIVKGGFIVDVGVDAFLPGSQLDVVPVRNPEEHLGKTYEFRILKINLERKNIVVSRRELIEESRRESRRKILAEIQVGELRSGAVKNITDFGAFIDLDGIDGLLHVTDMTWGRINHPSEILKVGDEVEVMILEVDLEKERISLGLKQTQDNPWEDIEARYPIGGRVHGLNSSKASKDSSTFPKCPGPSASSAPPTCSTWATKSMRSSSASAPKTRRSPSACARSKTTRGKSLPANIRSDRSCRAKSATSPPTVRLLNSKKALMA
jgi:small subunit ribosomal protein S1